DIAACERCSVVLLQIVLFLYQLVTDAGWRQADSVYDQFCPYPLFAVVGVAGGVDTVIGTHFARDNHIDSLYTELAGCAGIFTVSAEQLIFHRTVEVLL